RRSLCLKISQAPAVLRPPICPRRGSVPPARPLGGLLRTLHHRPQDFRRDPRRDVPDALSELPVLQFYRRGELGHDFRLRRVRLRQELGRTRAFRQGIPPAHIGSRRRRRARRRNRLSLAPPVEHLRPFPSHFPSHSSRILTCSGVALASSSME